MRYEKEMIPVLTDYLSSEMGYSIIANELDSSYGVADIVATMDLQEHGYYPFNNIIDVFLLNSIPYKKIVSFEEICRMSSYSEKHLKYTVLKGFIDGGFLVKEGVAYRRIKRLTISKNPIIAIEAKLKKWRDAFLQAMRYKKYADFSYVALMESTLKNVDLKLFEENNIGLLAISPSKSVNHIFEPQRNKDKHDLYALYVNGVLFREARC